MSTSGSTAYPTGASPQPATKPKSGIGTGVFIGVASTLTSASIASLFSSLDCRPPVVAVEAPAQDAAIPDGGPFSFSATVTNL